VCAECQLRRCVIGTTRTFRTDKKLEVPMADILAGRADVAVDPRAIDNPDLLDWYCEQGQRHTW
jgi:acetoacetyl-CoA synthetase